MFQPTLFDYIQRYGLLALALVTFGLQLFYPPARGYLQYASVGCILLSLVNGRSFIKEEDIRGWMLQNAALLAHAGVLVANGVMTA